MSAPHFETSPKIRACLNRLLLREHLRRRHAVLLPSPRWPFAGSYPAVARNLLHADVTSPYPSIMLSFSVFPAKDLLQILRDLREYPRAAKAQACSSRPVPRGGSCPPPGQLPLTTLEAAAHRLRILPLDSCPRSA